MAGVSSSETLLPVPTYQMPRLPVPQEYISPCLPELRIQGAIRYYAVLLPTNKVLFPSYVSFLSWRWKQYVLPNRCYPTYLQNDTASCASRIYNSECLSELRIQCAIGYYVVLVPPNNKQLKWFCVSLKSQGKPQGPVSIFSPDVPAGFILLFILFWDSVWCNFSKHPCEENRDFFEALLQSLFAAVEA